MTEQKADLKYGSKVTHVLQTLAGLFKENLNSLC